MFFSRRVDKPVDQQIDKQANKQINKQTDQQREGRRAEDAALAYLQTQGLTLVERNFLCKGGEIDLVMQEGASLVFVEVRKRVDKRYGGAAASVTPAKQRRMIIAAQQFLSRCRTLPPCRFDVVAIDGEHLQWLRNVIES